jgi:hypothetical protein
MLNLSVCALALLTPLSQNQQPWDQPLDKALEIAGLSQSSARFDETLLRFYRRGEFATPAYLAMSESPWRIPWMMDLKRRELAGFPGQGHQTVAAFGPWMNWSVRRTLISNPIAAIEEQAAKPEALARVLQHLGAGEVNVTAPPQVQQAAALVLLAFERAQEYRAAAFTGVDTQDLFRQMLAKDPFSTPFDVAKNTAQLKKVGVNMLAAGAHDLFQAAAKAREILATVPPTTAYQFEADTQFGRVLLTGSRRRTIPGDYVLVISTGDTDEIYVSTDEASFGKPARVIIDMGGNDMYLSAPELEKQSVATFARRSAPDNRPGPAGGLLAHSVLIDAKGNDTYRSHRPGLGSGRLGFAWLLDIEGNDTYDAYADSQGFGMFGGGILEDLSGSDRYEGFNQVQGCGQTAGFGYLADRAGDDTYVGNNTVIDFGSAQDSKNNTLMGQGAGNGRRADFLEGTSLAGGVGVLFDQAGNDRYSAAMFCQGVGYWEGVGALWDSAGTDRYDGAWYAMGASAHFAIGYLEDQLGDDAYNATMNMAIGAGHDFSAGILVDGAGNDSYKGPNLSLGAGNASGIGWLLELTGDDTYASSGITLGKAAEGQKASMRERALCFGLFMDLAGKDTYPNFDWVGNSREGVNWQVRNPRPQESQLGVFVDK